MRSVTVSATRLVRLCGFTSPASVDRRCLDLVRLGRGEARLRERPGRCPRLRPDHRLRVHSPESAGDYVTGRRCDAHVQMEKPSVVGSQQRPHGPAARPASPASTFSSSTHP
jgi:GTP cyclohydrolase II